MAKCFFLANISYEVSLGMEGGGGGGGGTGSIKITLLINYIINEVNRYNISILNQLTKIMNQQKNYLKKCPLVEPTSDQWKVIQFKMQLSLGTTAAVVKKIYNISNTHVSSTFSSYAKGSIVLQSFMETEQLGQNNKLEKVCQKGFDIGQGGMLFNVGYNRNIDLKAQRTFSFVMCKLAVGKSYCYAAHKYRENPIDCPEGFDSIYLYNEDENPQVFLHKYTLFKNYQIYPCYLIDFVMDSFKEQQTKQPQCDNCVKSPPNHAKLYCLTEEAHFCYDCDQEYHASKLGSKHQKVDISEKPKKFGFCQKHQDSKLQLYCSVCYEGLCINCKINGDHVSGEMGEHQLLKLKDAYSDISSKVKQIDPNIERRKNQLTQDLSNIDLKIKQVNTKATHVQQQIYALFHKALNELHHQTQKKLSFLIGDQLELKRQYDYIQWIESFLRYSLEVQEPHQFLQSWYKYSKYKKQVLSLSNLAINTQVKADMKLQGNIYVICEERSKKGMENNTNSAWQQQQSSGSPVYIETPIKPTLNQKSSIQKNLGSTQLRRTVFKKHYADKSKNMGSQPSFLKGSYDVQIPNSNQNQNR